MESQYQQTLNEAIVASAKPSVLYLQPSQRAFYRHLFLTDPYFFAVNLCGFDKLASRIHQPLAYLMGGCANHLAWFLQNTEEECKVIDDIRSELTRLGIDWTDPRDRKRMRRAMSRVDIRLSRGFYKSSTGVPSMLFRITEDPNTTLRITHGVDPKAWAMCEQMGDFIKSRLYREFFPDRIPEDEKVNINRDWIKLAGRTVPHKEPCVFAAGATSTDTGGHYDTFYTDDLCTEEQTPIEMEQACRFLQKIHGLSMLGGGTRGFIDRIHQGTRYSNSDDAGQLAENESFIHVYMPNEIHDEPQKLSQIYNAGVPTFPEAMDAEAILRLKKDHMDDPQKGPVAYFRNYLLIPDSESAELFPPAIVDRKEWEWVSHPKNPEKLLIRRQARDPNTRKKLVDEKTGAPLMVDVDPMSLTRTIGIDPSIAEVGDEWGVAVMGMDYQRFVYILEPVAASHTVPYLMDMVLHFEAKWHVHKIGVEAVGMQTLLVSMMQADPRFVFMKHKIVKVPAYGAGKIARTITMVSASLQRGDLFPHPDDLKLRAELKQWKPSNKVKDNRIDAVAIGMSVLEAPAGNLTDSELKQLSDMREQDYWRSVDPVTRIDTSDWFAGMYQ